MIGLCLAYLLFSNAVTFRRDKAIFYSRVLIFILLYSGILIFNDFYQNTLNKGIGLYGGLYNITYLGHSFHLFLVILTIIIIQLTSFYPRKVWNEYFSSLSKTFLYKFIYITNRIFNKTAKQFRIIEYPLLILFIIIGAFLIINSNDIVSIFISIELQSYGLYIICTLHRNSELSTLGGLTYFLLGSLSSCFILLGSSLLYICNGSTFLEGFYIISNVSSIFLKTFEKETNMIYWYKYYNMHISLIILSAGLLFKVSAAPFHFWSPDVYDAIPTIITTFVAIIAKISIFILLLDLVHFTSKALFLFYNFSWKTSLIISCLLSLIIGTIAGLTQFRIKRLYAYSTISHIGFILLALSINSIESIQAFIFYIIQYTLSNLNAFILLLSIGFSFYFLKENKDKSNQMIKHLEEKNNSPVQYISQLKGYFFINPLLALSLTITIFSFVGIPPLLGFFGKKLVISAALDKGYIFLTLISILTSVISAVYYLALIKQMFFFKPDNNNFNIILNNDLFFFS